MRFNPGAPDNIIKKPYDDSSETYTHEVKRYFSKSISFQAYKHIDFSFDFEL